MNPTAISMMALRRVLVAASLACAAAVTAQTAQRTQSFEVPLEGGGSVRVEADYKATVEVPPPTPGPIARRAMIEVADSAGDSRLRQLAPIILNRVAAGTAGSPLEIIDGADFTGDDAEIAKLPPIQRARQVGADYLVSVSLDRCDRAERRLDRPGHATIVNAVYTLTGSYRVLDAYTGATLQGGTCAGSRTQRISSGISIEGNPFEESLAEEFARKVADELRMKAALIRDAEKQARSLVTINAYACDPTNTPVYLPRYDGTSQTLLPSDKAGVGMMVEIDGMTVGTTPCRVPMLPGPHRIRLWREGFDDVTMHTVPYDGMELNVGVRMDAAQYARVLTSIRFMQSLTAEAQDMAMEASEQEHRHEVDRTLLPARIKVLEGHAQQLAQSGYRVYFSRDEKVEATELPEVEIHREFYPGGAPVVVPVRH